MGKYDLYLVERPSLYDGADVCGTAYGRLARKTLGDAARVIASPEEAKSEGIVALIYSDTPLVTVSLLDELCVNIEKGFALGYRIGDGYIKKMGLSGSLPLAIPPFKVTQVKDLVTLNEVILQRKCEIIERHLRNDVIFHDPFSVRIDDEVTIGKGAEIYPMVYLKGKTRIGENAVIYSYCDLTDTVIGDGTDARAVYSVSAKVGAHCTLGPFACFRKGAIVGNHCRVGDFVEIKNSTLEDEVKAAHLAYIGDSFVGENTNVGCGAIFANYDGKVKRSVIVGKNVFIGCNTNLVAPLEVEDGAYIAAGSTVTQDVPGNSLCIARARQVVKDNWERSGK